ncbi:hypothetical protein TNCV_171731 [Trichonephila clavipes]|nr:hypothetical protein TNCV_171731 [Trichonephila clavipes]
MERSTRQSGRLVIQFIEYLETPRHINYDEHGQHNTKKLQHTTQSSRLHDYRETNEERDGFPETSGFIPDVEDHVTFL